MTAKSAPGQPRLEIVTNAAGDHVAKSPLFRFRFLLDDGTVFDVVAHRDDSSLREAVLAEVGGKDRKIQGSATLGPVDLD